MRQSELEVESRNQVPVHVEEERFMKESTAT
jgi:hypothetical protein